MKVLVTTASKHGATAEIADELGEVIRTTLQDAASSGERDRVSVHVKPVDDVDSVEDYDAVVVGSAIYAGHWLQPARDAVNKLQQGLSTRPTWLFSSGPIGDPPKPEEDPVDVAGILEATGAKEHRLFAGKLSKGDLSFPEKAIVLALRAPEGDFRDWDAIRSWGRDIARELLSR